MDECPLSIPSVRIIQTPSIRRPIFRSACRGTAPYRFASMIPWVNLVRTLMDGEQEAGFYLFSWDGTNQAGAEVASGTYLYRLEAPEAGISRTRTMTLLR